MKKTKFELECEQAEENTGVRCFYVCRVPSKKLSVCEDDGALLIDKGGVRMAFDLNADSSLREQNDRMRLALAALELQSYYEKVKWSDEEVREQEEEDEDECPCCGRSRHY